MKKLIKDLQNKKVGIALAGGSVKGIAAHVGFMKAMVELGIKPVAIIGTSAGSDVGGTVAYHGLSKKTMDYIEDKVVNLKADDYVDKVSLPVIIYRIINKFKKLSGYIKGKKLQKFLNDLNNNADFSNCQIPFYAHTINLSRACEWIWEDGNLAKACRASSSIPFVFEPFEMKINDRYEMFWDGGAVGYEACEELARRHPDLDYLLIHDFHKHNEDPDYDLMKKKYLPVKLMFKLIDCAANEFSKLREEALKQYKIKHVEVRPDIPYSVDLVKPKKEILKKIIDCAHDEAIKILSK